MKKSLVLGVTVLLLSVTMAGTYAAGGNPIDDIYTQIIQKMDEIKAAIENQELNPTVNVTNTINMSELEPQTAYSVEEIDVQYDVISPDYASRTYWNAFAFPNRKEWKSITATSLTIVGYISDPDDESELDGYIKINGVTIVQGIFAGATAADPSALNAGTNTLTLWADASCELHLEKIIIEYQITPAN
jgi:hypothetical protein